MMKIATLIILIASVMGFTPSSNAQKISLKVKNAKIVDVFANIQKQTNYSFAYEKELLKNAKSVTAEITNKNLDEALKVIFRNQHINYKIHKNYIVLSAGSDKNTSITNLVHSDEQQSSISGIVQDQSGQLLQGASISIQGTSNASSTNANGEFKLNNTKLGDVIVVRYVGYLSQTITIQSLSTPFTIILKAEDNTIEDVVVTALGIKRSEKALSYQIQQVSGEELSASKGSNFVNSLVGKVAGAQINSSSSGPGSPVKVVLRGSKSIALNNNALYVIDGIPMNNSILSGGEGSFAIQPGSESIADINPEDIESLSVMTGPSAAALYGYEGANGVILITTKKGKADHTILNYNHNSMFSTPLLLPKFQNKYGNHVNSNQSWGDVVNSDYDPAKFFQTGHNMNNSLALSTGTEKSQNYFSVAYNNAEGIIDNNTYNRYNFMYRNTTEFLDDKLTFDFSANYVIQKDLNMMSQGQYGNPLPAVYLFPRGEDFSSIRLYERYDEVSGRNIQYWPFGDQGLTLQNPYWTMNRMDRINNRKRYLLTASLKYNILDNWNVTGRVNADNTDRRFTDSRHSSTVGVLSGPLGRYNLQQDNQNQIYADLISNYRQNWDNFSLNVNVGGSIRHRNLEFISITGDLNKIGNYFNIENLDRSVGTYKVDQDGLRRQTQSIFASGELGYKNAIYLTLTGRGDYDSALAMSTATNSTGFYYPSVGLSATLNELMTLPEGISYLKLRGSLAAIGRSYDPYLTTEQMPYDDQTDTYALPRIRPNYALKPEMTTTYEIGADMRFFNNQMTFNVTYYSADTKNQTHTILESGTEYDASLIQAGKVRNSGVELLLGIDKKWDKFSWNSNITYSLNSNKVVQLYSDEILQNNPNINVYVDKAVLGTIGSPLVRLTEGGGLGDIYSTSDFKRDNNGHIFLNPTTLLPIIESLGTNDYKKLGSILPKSHVGWRNSFAYDNLKLNISLAGRFGGLVVSNTQAFLDRYGVSAHSATLREQGSFMILNNEIPIENYLNIIGEGTGKSDFYTYKADNIRLQEISLEYKLRDKWFNNKAGVTVGISGNNLAFLYKKAPFDPEASPNASSTFYSGVDYFMQPSQRNIGFNVKVNF